MKNTTSLKQPDVWMQITIPSEFQPIGKYNIGVTAGIETTLGTYSMHLQPAFQRLYELSDADFPNATFAHLQCLTLPLSHKYKDDDLVAVVTELKKAIKSSTRNSLL